MLDTPTLQQKSWKEMERVSFVEKRCNPGSHMSTSLDSGVQRELLLMSDKDRRSFLAGMYYTLDVFEAGLSDSRCVRLAAAPFWDLLEHKQAQSKTIRSLDNLDNDQQVVQVWPISQAEQMLIRQYVQDLAFERERSDSRACALLWLQEMSNRYRRHYMGFLKIQRRLSLIRYVRPWRLLGALIRSKIR